MRAPSREKVVEARNALFGRVAACAAVLMVIHMVPKGFTPRSTFRLLCTVGYFSAALYLCWQMLEPRSRFMTLLSEWMYEDCPPSMERLWRRYLHALDRVVTAVAWVVIAFVASTALATLALWFPGISALSPLYNLVWWVSVAALMLAPFATGNLLAEVRQSRLLLGRETATGHFKPRPFKDLVKPDASESREDQSPVRLNGQSSFFAGGREWHWEDLTKNCVVFGQTGSGKTVCVLNPLVDAVIGLSAKSEYACSGLILDPKGDFRGKIHALCAKHGRERDLMVIDPADPNASMRWNPLDTDDDELELSARFAAVLEALGMKDQNSSFWIDSAKKFIRHAIALVRLTNPPGEPPSFADIAALAASFDAVVDRTDRLDVTDGACDQCLGYFANEWTDLADETRSSVQAHITNMIDPFLMEPYATAFAGRSTLRIGELLHKGRILYVHMPVADKEAMAKMIGTFVKLEFFRQVLKAPDKKRPSFFLCDEFQLFFTTAQGKGDADFFERNRQSNHVNIIATQNLPALLKVTPKKEPVDNLLGNCLVKIFLRNTDRETNKFASELFGQELVAMGGGGMAGMGLGKRGGFQASASATDQYDSVVRPERFTELSIPSRAHDVDYAESIVHDASGGVIDPHAKKLRWKVHPIVPGPPRRTPAPPPRPAPKGRVGSGV